MAANAAAVITPSGAPPEHSPQMNTGTDYSTQRRSTSKEVSSSSISAINFSWRDEYKHTSPSTSDPNAMFLHFDDGCIEFDSVLAGSPTTIFSIVAVGSVEQASAFGRGKHDD